MYHSIIIILVLLACNCWLVLIAFTTGQSSRDGAMQSGGCGSQLAKCIISQVTAYVFIGQGICRSWSYLSIIHKVCHKVRTFTLHETDTQCTEESMTTVHMKIVALRWTQIPETVVRPRNKHKFTKAYKLLVVYVYKWMYCMYSLILQLSWMYVPTNFHQYY